MIRPRSDRSGQIISYHVSVRSCDVRSTSGEVEIKIMSGQVRSAQVRCRSGQVTSGNDQVILRLGQVKYGQIRSGHVRSGPDRTISVQDRKKSSQFVE